MRSLFRGQAAGYTLPAPAGTTGQVLQVDTSGLVNWADQGRSADLTAAVTQTTSITTDVTLNAYFGTITTVSGVITPGQSANFGLNNSNILLGAFVRVWLKSYSGPVSATDGLVCVTGQYVSTGSWLIQIINVAASGPHDLNGTFEICFEVINNS